MYRQSEKNLLYRLTCPHNMVNVSPLTAEICSGVWGTPANFNGFRVLASLLHRRRSMEVNQTARRLAVSYGLVHCIGPLDTLGGGGSCPLTEFYQLQNSLWVKVLRSPILAALGLLHGTRAAAVSQTLWRGTRNEITEVPHRAPPIFGRAAITLGIGQHLVMYDLGLSLF